MVRAEEREIAALYHALRYRDPASWDSVWQYWSVRAAGWVRRHPQFRYAGEEVDYFVNRAFEKLWRAVDAEKLERFQSPGQLIQYFKLCVHSVILDDLRGPGPEAGNGPASLDMITQVPSGVPAPEELVLSQLDRHHLWATVASHIRSDEERTVVEAGLVRGMPPREIVSRYPGLFDGVSEVYRIKRNLLDRLSRDNRLRQFLL